MRFYSIKENESLVSLGNKVGRVNVDAILNANSLVRGPHIGAQLKRLQSEFIAGPNVTKERKLAILNTMTMNSDIFEKSALTSEKEWKVLSGTSTFISSLSIPESIQIADSVNMIGNKQTVPKAVYDRVVQSLMADGKVDPAIFNEYSTRRASQVVELGTIANPMQWFNIPWGQITLYSSIGNDYMDFPCYPEEYDDGVVGSYDTMPDLLYQYEPWYVYKSSGPRSNSYTFKMHRDMWSGDHRDGKCIQLIRFCEANCYPEFKGAAVNSSMCTLLIAGKPHIHGILTSAKTHWYGPIGQDGHHLAVDLTIDITEIAIKKLDYHVVRNIGMR